MAESKSTALTPPPAYEAFCEAVETLELVTADNEREGDYETALDALRDCLGDFQGVRKDLGPWVHQAVLHLAAARAATLPSNVVPLRPNSMTEGRRQHALKALRLAEAVLQVELAELPEGHPARSAIAGALRSTQAGALHLEPVEGGPQ